VISAAQLLAGYANGIFPMARAADDPELLWFEPRTRGILPVGGLHVSRSMRRHLRRCDWTLALNRDFDGVLAGCADRDETWINAPLAQLYRDLHRGGDAHSIEVRDGAALIGGVFGVTIGGAFFGESMFSARSNASKTALMVLSVHLARCGFTLFDTQFPTAHLTSLGGQTLSQAAYLRRLFPAMQRPADITARPLPSLHEVMQASTQTS